MTFGEALIAGEQFYLEKFGEHLSMDDEYDLKIMQYLAHGFLGATNWLRKNKRNGYIHKILSECLFENEDFLFHYDVRKLRRAGKKYFHKDIFEYYTKTMEGCLIENMDGVEIITYFPDAITMDNRTMPLEVVRRNLIATIAHERCHYNNHDAKLQIDPNIAEPRANKFALEILEHYHNDLFNQGNFSDKSLIDFIRSIKLVIA